VSGSEAAKMSDDLKQQLRGALGDKWKVFPFFILFLAKFQTLKHAAGPVKKQVEGLAFFYLFYFCF
jgi:hypothetical protein